MEREKYTILLVDDSLANLVINSEVLSSPEYEILTAKNAERALKIAIESKPDLVVLDIAMPGIDGFQFYQMLKDRADTESTKVMFLTSLSDSEVCSRAMKMGAVDFLVKPLDTDTMRKKVAQALGRQA